MKGIKQLLKRYKLWNAYQEQRPVLLWEKVVGEKIAHLTRARRVSKGTLVVEVSSPSVAQELAFFKEQYRTRINASLKEGIVKQIRFVPGHFVRRRVRRSVSLSSEDKKRAKALFSQLEDRQLRTAFERLYLALLSREQVLLAAGARYCSRCGVVFKGDGDICPGCRFDEIAQGKEGD